MELKKIENRTKCVSFQVRRCGCKLDLTYLADNVDACPCIGLPDLFLQGVMKVRIIWLIRQMIGHGNKTLTSPSEHLCVSVVFTYMWYSCRELWAPCARGCCSTCVHLRFATFLGCRLSSIWGAQCRCGPHLKINTITCQISKNETLYSECIFYIYVEYIKSSFLNEWMHSMWILTGIIIKLISWLS